MKKQVMYLGYIIKEEDGRIDIYKNKIYMSSVESDWNHGVMAAKSKIDKVNGFRMSKRRKKYVICYLCMC